jgi:hypothetical protein
MSFLKLLRSEIENALLILIRATLGKLISTLKEEPPVANDTANYARAVFGQGLGMGWGDEAEAWARSKLGEGSYKDIREGINKNYAEFSERNPILAPVAEFAGGVLPLAASYVATPFSGGAAAPAAALTTARAAGPLAKLASSIPGVGGALTVAKNIVSNPYGRGIVVGGTTGAVSGAGSAEPDRRGEGAVFGTAIGAGLGGAIPIAFRSTSSALNWLRDRFSKNNQYLDDKAAGKIVSSMQKAEVTPDQLRARISEDELISVPSMLANADRSLVTLGETVANKGGRGPEIMAKGIAEQREGARDRVIDQIRKNYRTSGDFYGDEEKIIESLRINAKPSYDRAYAFGEVKDPEVLKFMERPQFKEALDLYEKSLVARGKNLPTVPVLDASGKEIGTRVAPTVQILDEVKKNLDDLIEKQTDSVTRKRTKLGDAYKEEKNLFLDELDKSVPDYGVARALFKGDAEVRDALRSGMNDFNKLDHEQITKLMKSMGPSEREAFVTGSVRNLQSAIMGPSQDFNAAQRIIGSPKTRERLLALAEGNQSQFKLLHAVLERESELFEAGSKMISGSPTARRTAAAKAFDGDEGAGNFIASAVTGGWANSLLQTAARVIRSGSISDDVAERVATMLSSTDPAKNAAAVTVLEDYAIKAARAAQRLEKVETNAVRAAATTIQPAPRDSSNIQDIDADIEKRNKAEKDENLSDIDEDIRKRDEQIRKDEKAKKLKDAIGTPR